MHPTLSHRAGTAEMTSYPKVFVRCGCEIRQGPVAELWPTGVSEWLP